MAVEGTPLELMFRGILMYWFLFIVLRWVDRDSGLGD